MTFFGLMGGGLNAMSLGGGEELSDRDDGSAGDKAGEIDKLRSGSCVNNGSKADESGEGGRKTHFVGGVESVGLG